jgi:hypothetical protein
MDHSLASKHPHHDRFASASFDSPCSLAHARPAEPEDFAPLEQLQMMRFKGESWKLFGPVMSGEKSS